MNQSIVIVDGNSLINRAYFAMSELKNSKGVYTGGVHGLTSMVFNLIENFNPTHFCVAFDMKGPTFRHLTYDAYKGTRKGMPNELAMQMPIIKEILDVLNIARVELQGYEADDLIGTIAKQCVDKGMVVNVITGDKDALQLVAFGAKVHITKKGISQLKLYEEADVMEDLGVHANQVIDYKGLSGDSSDNIPGVPSIGPKTASKLLESFGTVENLLENVSQVENKRIQGLLVEYAEQALLSKRLATIFTEVPIEVDFDQMLVQDPNLDEAVKAFKYYELTSLLNKLKINVKNEVAVEAHEWVKMDCKALNVLLKTTLDFTFKLYYDVSQIVSHKLAGAGFIADGKTILVKDVENLIILKDVFENENIAKSGYNLKDDYLYLMGIGIDLKGVVFDGFIAAYLIDPARRNYDLAEVVFENNSNKIISTEDILGKGVKKLTFTEVDHDTLVSCIVSQLNAIIMLKDTFEKALVTHNLKKLFDDVEIPLIKILADIEFTGFKVDVEAIDYIDVQLIEKIKEIETTIFEMADR